MKEEEKRESTQLEAIIYSLETSLEILGKHYVRLYNVNEKLKPKEVSKTEKTLNEPVDLTGLVSKLNSLTERFTNLNSNITTEIDKLEEKI